MNKKSIFIFKRDFRLDDNTGLMDACQNSESVIPCFIFDPCISKLHPFADFRFKFLLESLYDLQKQLKKKKSKLYFFYGSTIRVLDKLIKTKGVDSVFLNGDYTPFGLKRDQEIARYCKMKNILFKKSHDALLYFPDQIKNTNNKPFTVFTPFFKNAILNVVQKPVINVHDNYYTENFSYEYQLPEIKDSDNLNNSDGIIGGRVNALTILENLGSFTTYDMDRNFPERRGTTKLSAHNRFGTCSIREVYHAIMDCLGIEHQLMAEIHWREFFTHIAYHFPYVMNHEFKKKYEKIPWENDKNKFLAWCNGKTGFPIVDAGMRELNQTGSMHNRVRMITASFLIKDLHIDWKKGARYFAEKLIDYDPAVNNGNWQWTASTGCDSVPYFRIFNPWLQQKKYDPECVYIKKWISELKHLTPQEIHDLENERPPSKLEYPQPLVHHYSESKKTKEIFKKIV